MACNRPETFETQGVPGFLLSRGRTYSTRLQRAGASSENDKNDKIDRFQGSD